MANKQATGKEVRFSGKSCELRAFVAEPAVGAGPWPALIVVHEWWGLDHHIRDVARRLAAEGYFAVAPDLYSRQGHKVTKDPDIAADLMGGLLVADGVDDLVSTIGLVKNQPKADAAHIGVVGFCMGGSYATLLPCISRDIKAAAPFYGEIPSDDQLKSWMSYLLRIWRERWMDSAPGRRSSRSVAQKVRQARPSQGLRRLLARLFQ